MMNTKIALPGLLYIGAGNRGDSKRSEVLLSPLAGYMVPSGVHSWEKEVSVVERSKLSLGVRSKLKLVLPEEQIVGRKNPIALNVAKQSPLLAVHASLVKALIEEGVRVYTVGADKTTSQFYFIAEGGGLATVKTQGDVLQMLSPALAAGDSNERIEQLLETFIQRALLHLSDGVVTEMTLELAGVLPSVFGEGGESTPPDLDGFETQAKSLQDMGKVWATEGAQLAKILAAAAAGSPKIPVPIFGEAMSVKSPELAVDFGSAAGNALLPPYYRWFVEGEPKKSVAQVRPVTEGAASSGKKAPPIASSLASPSSSPVAPFPSPAASPLPSSRPAPPAPPAPISPPQRRPSPSPSPLQGAVPPPSPPQMDKTGIAGIDKAPAQVAAASPVWNKTMAQAPVRLPSRPEFRVSNSPSDKRKARPKNTVLGFPAVAPGLPTPPPGEPQSISRAPEEPQLPLQSNYHGHESQAEKLDDGSSSERTTIQKAEDVARRVKEEAAASAEKAGDDLAHMSKKVEPASPNTVRISSHDIDLKRGVGRGSTMNLQMPGEIQPIHTSKMAEPEKAPATLGSGALADVKKGKASKPLATASPNKQRLVYIILFIVIVLVGALIVWLTSDTQMRS